MDQGIHKLAPVKDDSTQTVSSDPERNSFVRHQHSIDDQINGFRYAAMTNRTK